MQISIIPSAQRLVTPEVLVVFAVTAVAATDIAEVGDELDPFDPLHQLKSPTRSLPPIRRVNEIAELARMQ
jgi:hypothetical protein